MSLAKKLKSNAMVLLIVAAYLIAYIIRKDIALTSVTNSFYYIKEMLLIMPVVFILTALLDLWVPKEKIIRYLGKQAKIKGILLALVLGSVSAGPIYAAFPLCIMLHKKGASIRNLVIILSAWAVIKIPMLLTEMKFLGFPFMIVRWMLTVIAILIVSWITARIVRDKDIPRTSETRSGISIDRNACIGCGICANNAPAYFMIAQRKAEQISNHSPIEETLIREVLRDCPAHAISWHPQEDGSDH